MLQKQVHMSLEFQRTFKSSMSFSLKHFYYLINIFNITCLSVFKYLYFHCSFQLWNLLKWIPEATMIHNLSFLLNCLLKEKSQKLALQYSKCPFLFYWSGLMKEMTRFSEIVFLQQKIIRLKNNYLLKSSHYCMHHTLKLLYTER